MSIEMPFTHVILDDDGEPLRQVRWSRREVKWYKDTHPDAKLIALPTPNKSNKKENLVDLVGECLY